MANQELLTVINSFGLLFAILNSFTLGLRLRIGRILEHFFLTRLAKGDVTTSTTLFVVMVVVSVIVVPFALPLAVSALVPSAPHVRIWDVAWPLLAFVIAPLLIGCLMRLRYEETVAGWARPILIVSLTCLLLYVNLFIYAFTSLFVSVWWGAYLAAIAVPVLGIALGSIISTRNSGARHASVITTAQRSITGAIIVTIFNYTQPLANVSVTVINTIGIILLLILAIEWGRAQAHERSAVGGEAPPARAVQEA
jgi:bile acid:Na+ symporter, BASS family